MLKLRRTTSVKLDLAAYKYGHAFALANGLSITDALSHIVSAHEKTHPVGFVLKRCFTADGEFYALCAGSGAPFWTGETFDEASKALAELRTSKGFDAKRFPLAPDVEDEDLRDPPLRLVENRNVEG